MKFERLLCLLRGGWRFLTLRQTLLYFTMACLCFYSAWMQWLYRVPGSFNSFMAPLVGTAFGIIGFISFARVFLPYVKRDESLRTVLKRVEQGSGLVIWIFIFYGFFLYGNAVFDDSGSKSISTEVASVSGWVVTLDSWKGREKPISIFLSYEEKGKLWAGEKVLVRIREGNFNIPWVTTIRRNDEEFYRELLSLSPTASVALRGLARFYIEENRYKESLSALEDYRVHYPGDTEFAAFIAGEVGVAGYYHESVAILEGVVKENPTYGNLQLLGWALSYQGNKKKAAEVLERSIPLNPNYWQAYYHLGYVYNDLNNLPRAVEMFDKTLELKPRFPEVEKKLSEIKRRLARYQ